MDIAQMLARLDAAVKSVTEVSDLGDSILSPGKFKRFLRIAQSATKILPVARRVDMDSQQEDIDRTGFQGRILRSGDDGDGDHRDLNENEFAKLGTWTNKLIAKELQAVTSLRDKALRRNIEKGGLEDTLIDLFGEAAGRDIEEFALLADTEIAFGEDDVLSKTDGWVRRAGQKIYGRNVSGQVDRDFNPLDGTAIDAMAIFEAQLAALPKEFLNDASTWRYFVPWEIANAYQDQCIARGTALGDRSLVTSLENLVPYKGIPVIYAPGLERSKPVNLSSGPAVKADKISGRISLLTHPDNMAWGVFHEVTIEPEREAKKRRTDFVLSMEGDADYEDENAAVAAFVDHANPQAA